MAVAQYGGDPGLRDRGLLESALAQPRQAFGGEFAHTYPFGMAAAYAFHIAKNHPFIDGNKRAALMCAGAFCE
ncbi:MAG: Fic family protein [Planctomycetota bacterium]|nr:Fic family protein [Planctomycetota bacterium]